MIFKCSKPAAIEDFAELQVNDFLIIEQSYSWQAKFTQSFWETFLKSVLFDARWWCQSSLLKLFDIFGSL